MENSTKAVLGFGALSFLACSGNPDMNEIGSKKDLEECEKNLSSREEVDACKDYKIHMKEERERMEKALRRPPNLSALDPTVEQLRSEASGTIRDCTSVEEAHIAKALALASAVTTMGEDRFPTPALVSPKCSDGVPHMSESMLGFITLSTIKEIPAVTPVFFEPRNAGCVRAATIYALGLAQQTGSFAVYDGPSGPDLPYKVRDAVGSFNALCEEQEMVYPTPRK